MMLDLIDMVKKSGWWHKASCCIDSHYSNMSGIMLTDHLLAVAENIEAIFAQTNYGFFAELFCALEDLRLDKETVKKELLLVALLHDIGKTQHDKMLHIIHPLNQKLVIKRHSIVSVYAAMEIFGQYAGLPDDEKQRMYWCIEQHDISYGLYRQFKEAGIIPAMEKWKKLNDKIINRDGAGLMYLLIFKLADIHGHANISDVIWFYNTVQQKYFKPLGLYLPIPVESDMR